jgi:sortase B
MPLRKKILIALIILFAAIFLVCAFLLGKYLFESMQSKQVYDELASLVEDAMPTNAPTLPPDPEKPTDPPTEPPSPYVEVTDPRTGAQRSILREYAEVYTRNPDLVGWLKIDGTVINYPVMQTPDNPNYYLQRDFYGNYSAHGCLYAQENSNIATSSNITIYGHNMKDGSMFAGLFNYGYYGFWQEHRYITFDTLTEHRTYEIFAVFDTTASEGEGFAYHTFVDGGEGAYNWFIDNCRALRYYNTGVSTQYGDQFITLSTCEYTQTNGRLVLVAKLVKE